MSSRQEYPLGGDHNAAARLDLQHDVWKNTTGFSLHPHINLSPQARVADIGTGTGIWLFDLLSKVPSTVQLDGFDVDLSLAPPRDWLPGNVTMRRLDIFGDIPEDYVGKYDMINIRYFLLVVKDGDALTILKPLLKMLKPGGWIQWSEMDLRTIHVLSNDPAASTVHTKELMDFATNPNPDWPIEKQYWVSELRNTFEKAGMRSVEEVRSERPLWNLPRLQDCTMLLVQEIGSRQADSQRTRDMVQRAAKEIADAKRGIAIDSEIVTVIGRKAYSK